MSKELTDKWERGELHIGAYYLKLISGALQVDFFEGLKFCYFNSEDIEEVLAPVPTYDQFVDVSKKVEELKLQLEYAERTLKNIRILMTCDPSDMKELDENFCANQLALETVNGYF